MLKTIQITKDAWEVLEEQKCQEAPTYSDVIVQMHTFIQELIGENHRLRVQGAQQ